MTLARPELARLAGLAGLMIAAAALPLRPAMAQSTGDAAAATGSRFQARAGLTQAWTDNLRLQPSSGAGAGRDAALITTVSPGFSLSTSRRTLRASIDYSLNAIAYTKSDQPSQIQNSLSAQSVANLLDGALSVDARASIGQQAVSAFGPVAASTSLANPNQREVTNLSLSPALRGRVGDWANVELRGSFGRVQARNSSLGDSQSSGGSFRLNSAAPGPLSAGLLVSTQRNRSGGLAANARTESATVNLGYRPDPDWSVGAIAGRERSDVLTGFARQGATYGVNTIWSPTPRTRIAGDWQRHEYGDSHTLSVEHRLARMALRFSDSQSLNLGNVGSLGGLRSNYDLYFQLFASVEPDPIRRDAYVRRYLESVGLSAAAPANSGFLSAGPSRQRSQSLGASFQGVRSTVAMQVTRSLTGRIGTNSNAGDLASNQQVEQRSYSLTAGHQLDPQSSISLSLSRQESRGQGAGASTTLNTFFVNWSARLGRTLSAQLGTRHSRFTGPSPYSENSVTASMTQLF